MAAASPTRQGRWVGVLLTVVALGGSQASLVEKMSIVNQRLAGQSQCQDSCTFTLVESIADNLTYSASEPIFISTYTAHKRLLARASQQIHLATFYWTLTDPNNTCPDNTSFQGKDIFQDIENIVKEGKISVKIAQNITSSETDQLAQLGAEVRTLEFVRLLNAGVMHTKMWIVDSSHMYIGSGNFDWRSYTQTKEVGVLIEDCPCLGSDAEKLFEVYWYLGATNASIPQNWPPEYSTDVNQSSPISVHYNSSDGQVYLSSSPPPLCPEGRTKDLDAILNVIASAKKYIFISVMDYFPLFLYTTPKRFWPAIDDALKSAAIDHHVGVYLLASQWNHTYPYMKPFLKSLYDLNRAPCLSVNVQVKLFTVPVSPAEQAIPYARVSHSKYMVTDQHAYIGTSNWAGDYFHYTAGVAFVLEEPQDGNNLRTQLVQLFWRDWNSNYTSYV